MERSVAMVVMAVIAPARSAAACSGGIMDRSTMSWAFSMKKGRGTT
jgi:hypothetical protein